MKCRSCPKMAVLHVTEVRDEERFEELHFCEECGRRYLYDPPGPSGSGSSEAGGQPGADDETAESPDAELELAEDADAKPCPECGIKFVEFRNTGRLGCPHDYDHFREELLPLLESIHGDVKHTGKSPRRRPGKPTPTHQELAGLRKKLQQAIHDENYEAAAGLRDRIRGLEDVGPN